MSKQAGPLSASAFVLFVTATIIPSDYGTPQEFVMLLGVLAAVGIACVEALGEVLDLGALAISFAMTILIAVLATLEYTLCADGWQGDAFELMLGCACEAIAMVFLATMVHFAFEALKKNPLRRLYDESFFDNESDWSDNDQENR